MTTNSIATQPELQSLLKQYHSLPEDDAILLEFLSLVFEPISKQNLLSMFNRFARSERCKAQQGYAALNRLAESGLLVEREGQVQCRRELVEEVSTHAALEQRATQMCRFALESSNQYGKYGNFGFAAARRLLYTGDSNAFLMLARRYDNRFFSYGFGHGLTDPKEPWDFFTRLVKGMATTAPLDFYPKDFSYQLVHFQLLGDLQGAENSEVCRLWLEHRAERDNLNGIHPILFEGYLARGDWEKLDEMLQRVPVPELLWCRSVAMGREPDPSLEPNHQESVTQLPLLGFLYSIACLKTGNLAGFRACLRSADGGQDTLLRILQELTEGNAEESLLDLLNSLQDGPTNPLFLFTAASLLYWGGFREDFIALKLDEAAQRYQHSGHRFLARQLRALSDLGREEGEPGAFLAQIRCKERWEHLLSGLERLSLDETPANEQKPAQRVVWELDLSLVHPLKVKIQKWGKKGAWTSGRQIDLEQLGKHYPHDMDEHDKRVFERFVVSAYRGRREVGQLILALVGHPRLLDKKGRNLRLTRGSAEITVKSSEESFQVQSSLITSHGIAYRKIGPTDFEVIELDERLHNFLGLLSRNRGVEVPKDRLESVAKILRGHAKFNLRVSSDCKLDESGETVEAGTELVLRLTPEGQGLRALTVIAPVGPDGPVYLPGKGESFFLMEKDQKLVTYQRDLKSETKKWKSLSKKVTHLSKVDQVVEEPLHCLEFLEALSEVKDLEFRVEWPQGVKFQFKKRMGWKDFGLSVRRKKDWLEVDGRLQLSEAEQWSLTELLERHREQKSRFIELGNGEFLALSEEFHRRLDALQRAATKKDKESLALDPLSASVLLDDSNFVDTDEFWETLQGRLEKSRDFKPNLPKNLKATLRPYQEEGFRWLAASAQRGVGCCLADDMGLGKTLQALALVAGRAKAKGKPTLIVAPTSVCFNWMEEVRRFTPDLQAHLFNQMDRETALKGLTGRDLVITSYGLLVNEIEKFREVKWSNLILDESQAVKNPDTKRFKAAVAINADFRMATTGTPIENRIDEIWALFRILNPGLLGTRKSFDKAYSGLEELEDKRESLRRLLSPFILRRLKSQVLKDLPPRTDVNLMVEMSKDEKLHYESLRVHALGRLENSKQSDAISILTELTRLRLACCHPRLVDPDSRLEGAKLKALLRLLQDLKDSGHRALIFSQFVGHLTVVKEELDRVGCSYLYLDGSTPAKSRGKLVKKFQEGEEDFFLISLMAGGTGLNLTAANYVVHLDPWWNPAVEDQASDRAHRIGQKQPVTVYRLITKGTIEEKILELHKDKRELADTLLSGTDKAGKLSSEELLKLMKETVMTV